ncbi:MAG: polysaccharide deacetylase family protein [Crocinitomicaceae bacterium]|nr:polysaccharide deacetylase family protein [Crocinitomicaceae bacterium]
MLSVLANNITPRLKYVLDFCFTQKGEPYNFIAEKTGDNRFLDLSDLDSEILSDSSSNKSFNLSKDGDQLLLNGKVDTLGTIFYLLSRYEEYGDYEKDEHGRYLSAQHSLVRLDLHLTPVVDLIVRDLWDQIGLDYSKVQRNYVFTPSFDIDIAWAFKNRGVMRQLGSVVKHGKAGERIKVFRNKAKDPYDTYDEIKRIGELSGNMKLFFLLGDGGKYDKNISHKNSSLKNLINDLDQISEVGIHPSYASYLSVAKIKEEKARLEKIMGKEVNISRQHFLKLEIPNSYQTLLKAGMNEDYTMGFVDDVGFRAGTSFPFFFFDLEKNEVTDLRVHPYAYMDGTFMQYLELNPVQSKPTIAQLINEVKEVGGEFISIWHNSSINDYEDWQGWKEVFDFTIEKGLS